MRSRTIEARAAERARIVLLAADGWPNRDIAGAVGMHYNQVGTWRKRYIEFGLAGLSDKERPGRPHVYGHDDVLLLVKLVTEPPPESATRWTMEAVAEAMATHGVPMSASQAWRICNALDLKPWQVESWMTSHDPDFWEKASDVCGLYLDPPQNAVVWSVDEKSGMLAKSRINPTKPAIAGKPVRREFEYKRNGTAVLFAALDVHDGGVAGWVTESTKSENFVAFLGDLGRITPKGLDLHCIAD
jgi:transposase